MDGQPCRRVGPVGRTSAWIALARARTLARPFVLALVATVAASAIARPAHAQRDDASAVTPPDAPLPGATNADPADPAGGAEPADDAKPARGARGADGADFGPQLTIETIEIVGNESTAERLIRRALPIREGDVLRAGDPRLQKARFSVLALGYFRAVDTALRRGSRRGQVVLQVVVVERGTVVLESLHFGTSLSTPWWAGLDISERNLLGTGLGLGVGGIYAARGDIAGASDQKAFTLRLADTSVIGSPIGLHGAVTAIDASEPFRVLGDASDDGAQNFEAFSYSRLGVIAGVGINPTPLTRLTLDARVERVSAELPADPRRVLPDGAEVALDLGLAQGTSRVVVASAGLDRDTRPDPILPYQGSHIVVLAQLGVGGLGSDYEFGSLLGRYERWWPVRSHAHVVSVHLTGGLVVGDAPLFDRLHVADFNRLLTPRALGMVLSTTPASDLLGTGADEVTYADIAASAVVEYSYRLFRSKRRVYGGDLFVGAGLVAAADRRADGAGLPAPDTSLLPGFPVDLMVDAGLRIDTEIGIFELTFANALGRVQL